MKINCLYDKRAILLDQGQSRVLVVSDLHIGFEEKFRISGVRIQSEAQAMLSDLETIIASSRATDLIVNGDVKSGTGRILESEWEIVPKFLTRLTSICRVSIVPGNHDGGLTNLLPDNAQLEDVNGKLVSDTLVLHGHTKPLIKFKDCKRLIIGHIHPVFHKSGNPLSGQPVWAFLKIPKKTVFGEMLEDAQSTLEVIVMPSFNLELASSGIALTYQREERRAAPLALELKDAEEAMIVTLNGEIIGDSSQLSSVF